ncbi:MAG: PH domain-containing protein [Verrucomicrobia bacterium]|nr:PH domain-containing protein [Verrucomicrobiota bacterium]
MRTRLRETEFVVMVTKKHPLNIILVCMLTIIFFVLLVVFWRSATARWVFGLGFVGLACAVAIMFWVRQRDIWIVTTQRVIDERGIFSLYSMESPLDKITNVSVGQSLLGRMLGYGLVQIQTAGEAGITEQLKIMSPRAFREAIFEQREAYLEKMSGRSRPEKPAPAEEKLIPGVTKECPFCAEIIKAKARICRFCNRELPEDAADNAVPAPEGPSRKTL